MAGLARAAPAVFVLLWSSAFVAARAGTAGKVAANFHLAPGTTAAMGWLLLGEELSPTAIFGFALASVGVRPIVRAPATSRPEAWGSGSSS